MAVKKISKKNLAKVLAVWRREFNIIVPSRATGVTAFSEWDGEDVGFLDWYRNTSVPPKAVLLPPMEKMISFCREKDGYKMEVPVNEHKQIIFGVRPCDARGLAIIDNVFTEGYEDYYYVSRRRNTLLVGLGCTNPQESCFCMSMDVDPAASKDVDVMFNDTGDEFVVEAFTAGGEYLLKIAEGAKNATGTNMKMAISVASECRKKLTRAIDTRGVSNKLQACFNDEDYWEQVAAKCVSCGICTFLCPTCFCFDINDEMVRKQGARYRGWDSCSFRLYTSMPMENPREEKWRRVRQRVCHKFEFYPMNLDIFACTGCGRCIQLCPVNWDITRVIAGLPQQSDVKEKAAALKG